MKPGRITEAAPNAIKWRRVSMATRTHYRQGRDSRSCSSLSGLCGPSLDLKNFCHLILATRAFVGALIMPRTIGKDLHQHHSRAAPATRRTSDHPWRIANMRTHFFLPTLQLAERDRIRFLDALSIHHGRSDIYKMILCAASCG